MKDRIGIWKVDDRTDFNREDVRPKHLILLEHLRVCGLNASEGHSAGGFKPHDDIVGGSRIALFARIPLNVQGSCDSGGQRVRSEQRGKTEFKKGTQQWHRNGL